MITIRVPVRVSFLGGGSDVLPSVAKRPGLVLGCSIQQYSTIIIRHLPPYHPYKTRLSYSKIETVNDNYEIEHNVIRNVLKMFGIEKGVEISYISDIPSGSGLGTSSSFVVGLIHGLAEFIGSKYSKLDLYRWAVELEQDYLKENIGLQDAMWAAMGGLAHAKFKSKYEIEYSPILLSRQEIEKFESHLLLFFTKIPRSSSAIAGQYYDKLGEKKDEIGELLELTKMGIEAINRKDFLDVGRFMYDSWLIKKSLHPDISPPLIEDYCSRVKDCGGFVKLTGSGQSGCLLIIAPPKTHSDIKDALKDLIEIPIKISEEGSRRI